jgi:hypothetical protein
MTRWASRVVDTKDGHFLQAIRSQGPVTLIATPRSALRCRPAPSWRRIENDSALADFDQIPLTSRDGRRIESVFVRGEGRAPLNADMFMAADAPLLSFVESADRQRFRFLLADGEVAGLVTLSDLQRLPVYALLFGLVIAVEVLLMDWIRKVCGAAADAWLEDLNAKQRGTIERHWKAAQRSNVAIDRLSCATFGQEIDAAIGLGLFMRDDESHQRLCALKTLRDQICHAAEVAPTPEYALKIPAHVRDAQRLAEWLQRASEEQSL